jgi:CHAD domain-containing protein
MATNDAESCYAAQAILQRAEVMARQGVAVRENRDVEAVHDMRVASRRLRTALELFEDCLPARKARPWRKAIRRVTKALGQARDSDVQIESVKDFLDDVEDRRLRPGIQRLLLRLRQQRDALQADVIDALDRLDDSGVLAEIEDLLGLVQAHAQLNRIDTSDPAVRHRAAAAITARLEQMLAYEAYIRQPEAIEQLHAMRIAAKHLRYAMEIYSPLYGGDLEEPIQSVRRVQTQLGDIHDGDVWVAFLPIFLEEERRRTVKYFGSARAIGRLVPGVEHLLTQRQNRRKACYREFVGFWEELKVRSVWAQLCRIVAPAPDLPPEAQEPPA